MDNMLYLYLFSFSFLVNIVVFFVLKFTGVGIDAWQRFLWKRKFRKGNFSYGLLLNNSGKLEEVFRPVNDKGLVEYSNNKYLRNPKMTVEYRGLKANFWREGNVTPIDPFECFSKEDFTFSNNELDNVMSANNNNELLEWIKNNKGVILIIVGLLVLAGVMSAYFGYNSWTLLRDGGVVNTVSEVVSRV